MCDISRGPACNTVIQVIRFYFYGISYAYRPYFCFHARYSTQTPWPASWSSVSVSVVAAFSPYYYGHGHGHGCSRYYFCFYLIRTRITGSTNFIRAHRECYEITQANYLPNSELALTGSLAIARFPFPIYINIWTVRPTLSSRPDGLRYTGHTKPRHGASRMSPIERLPFPEGPKSPGMPLELATDP